ncbi:site-specific recombinase [Solimonas terrae]|uniref:Site-specific recombinase n=2 Tax=Solimonas terrae TaxID=1396819 RepID=A0A6M2BPZ8_9GAMM|nr:site-specific recombinase [Solimonas terrae]
MPPAERQARALDAALARIAAADETQRLDALAALVDALRPARPRLAEPAQTQLQRLTERVREDPAVRASLRDALVWLLGSKQPLRLFTESGVLAQESFFAGLRRRLGERLLPEEWRGDELRDCLARLFDRDTDHVWVGAVADDVWVALLDALDFSAARLPAAPGEQAVMSLQILDALQVVSYRIASIGLEPEFVRSYPAIERYESPFLMQNVEVHAFIAERRAAAAEKRAVALDDKQLLMLLDQCRKIIDKVRKQAAQTGASVSLTVLLVRIEQKIERLRVLLALLEDRPTHELNGVRVQFLKALVRAENRRHSIRELWSQTADLLSSRVIENASKTGEQYITTTRSEYFGLLNSALGAGFVVVVAAFIKLALSGEARAPFGEAVVYSLNYAAAFVLMYVCHFSLATKQPAVTAHRFARSIEEAGARRRIEALAEIVVRTFRSQFVAIAGNLLIVVPVALLIADLMYAQTGHYYVGEAKARHLLEDADPLDPRVWAWAAITGIWLFLTGLISGFYDNKAAYDRVPQRLRQLRWLRALLGRRGIERLATYIDLNLGGLVGSIAFGIMLGTTAALGRVLGVPLGSLHVTFVSANCAYAIVTLDGGLSGGEIARLCAGVAVIGLLNLGVSFTLALSVALRAQRIHFTDTRALLFELGRRFLRRPQHYFWPPRDPPADTPQ